ncbi:MAG: AAA family ATPase [Selenomonadaceae bacterium]|jgi:Flp pilus assembly protein, ATPase CpaE
MAEDIKMGIIIMVFSTASSVGKTLLSINMAAELAKSGHKVCVVDFDLQFGDVCNYLQLKPQKTVYDAQLAIQHDLNEYVITDYTTPYQYEDVSFSVLAAPLKLDEAYNVSAQAAAAVVSRLRSEYDYLVLDTTAAFSELNLALMDLSTIITFVGIVDFIPTIKNMKVGYDTMRGIGYDQNKIRFVLNRSKSKTNIELEDVEQLLEEPFYHVLPNDFTAAGQSIHKGVPLVLDGQNALAGGLKELVAKYTNRLQESSKGKASFSSLVKRFFK